MLRALRLRNFRCFARPPLLRFAALNLFIGPNNAGKTSLLSAAELMLRSQAPQGSAGPVNLEEQADFASFSSILRKAWSRREAKPTSFTIESEWDFGESGERQFWARMRFSKVPDDGSTYVSRCEYGNVHDGKRGAPLFRLSPVSASRRSSFKSLLPKMGARHIDFFIGVIPYSRAYYTRKLSAEAAEFFRHAIRAQQDRPLLVITPHRPEPRPLYVLDDPGMTASDRALISYLANLWTRGDRASTVIRSRISDGLRTLNLANHVAVARPLQAAGTAVQVRVSTGTKREFVTIADVGFGLSQALPLVARDASLHNGAMVVYQPEVHLHPFAQSRLADLFVQSTLRGNILFVETHSQYLILRLQALIARKKIRREAVKIFCVERAGSSSTVREMAFDSNGSPEVAWPRGFLDTGLDLAKDLARARQE